MTAYFIDHLNHLIPALGLWALLFFSPLIPSLVGLYRRQPTTAQDVEDLLVGQRSWKLLKLYTCGWCQAFWCGILAAVIRCYLQDLWLYFPLYGLAYPVVLYFLSCKIKEHAR